MFVRVPHLNVRVCATAVSRTYASCYESRHLYEHSYVCHIWTFVRVPHPNVRMCATSTFSWSRWHLVSMRHLTYMNANMCTSSERSYLCHIWTFVCVPLDDTLLADPDRIERWGAGVETQKNVRGEIGGWGRVPFNETYAPSLSTIYDGA